MKHTEEPWEIVPLTGRLDDWTGSRVVVRAKGMPGGICAIIGGASREEEDGNAHLIVAAPSLLKELKDMRAALWSCQLVADADSRKMIREHVAGADAAIALAEGVTV
jgi:hypothetical protein